MSSVERGQALTSVSSLTWLERLRYSGDDVAVPDLTRLRLMAEAIRTEIFESLASRDRRQVAWWPASGRQALVKMWNGANERTADVTRQIWSTLTGSFRRRPRGVAPSAPRSGS